jgi:transcriptional regulator with XRE-family HTH domain
MYVNFIIKKKYRVDDIAKEMRIATDTLYRYVRGENIIPPDRIIDLVKATGDIEYLEFFCDPCGYVPIRQSAVRLTKEEREQDQIRLSIFTGRALEEIEKAYEDGKLERTELQKIEKALFRLEQKAVELREKIKKEVE